MNNFITLFQEGWGARDAAYLLVGMTIDRGETVFAETGIRAKLYVRIVGIFMGKRLCPPNKAASRVCVRAATLRTGIARISLIEGGERGKFIEPL